MQDKYVGDVADFGKHGLLRFLSGMTDQAAPCPKLKLGLVWYLYHDEKHVTGDGKFINYLKPEPGNDTSKFRDCDPDLWEKLKDLVDRGDRCVHCAEKANLLPDDTSYYAAPLHFVSKMPGRLKCATRQHWLEGALRATKDADLVCVDPDNGIASDDKMHHFDGPKFVYVGDLQAFWERGQSLVIYHHTARNGDAEEQIRKVAAKIKNGIPDAEPIPLWFHRGAARIFFVVSQPDDKGELIKERVSRFLKTSWVKNGHFERVPYGVAS